MANDPRKPYADKGYYVGTDHPGGGYDFCVWVREKLTGYFVQGLDAWVADPQKIADFCGALERDHPDREFIPKVDPATGAANARPAERPPTPEQQALLDKQAELNGLRAKPWSLLTLTEQTKATDLAFQLGETVPAITATA